MPEAVIDARGLPCGPFTPPVRIVSLVPSLTELLFDLGLGRSEVVGRTRYCRHPAAAVGLVPEVGGTRDVAIEKVLALAPDLILAGREENRRTDVEELEQVDGGPRVFVVDPTSLADALHLIRSLGVLIGRTDAAGELVTRIEALARSIDPVSRGSALYLVWKDPWMTAAPGTFISDMLVQAGFVNAIWPSWLTGRAFSSPEAARYPELTLDEIVALAPGTILLPSEPYAFTPADADDLARACSEINSRFARRVKIHCVDGELYSWYGSRLEVALGRFADDLAETSPGSGRR